MRSLYTNEICVKYAKILYNDYRKTQGAPAMVDPLTYSAITPAISVMVAIILVLLDRLLLEPNILHKCSAWVIVINSKIAKTRHTKTEVNRSIQAPEPRAIGGYQKSLHPNEELTVVIPTLNEADAIGKVIDELREYGYNNILVVDGHSDDGTAEIAREKGAHVILQEGTGKADAIRTAAKYIKTPYVLVMDGDYTYDPAYIKAMLEVIKDVDEVIGARVYGRENMPLLNRLGNWIITKVFNLLFGTELRDVCSGMWITRTEVLREMLPETRGFSIEVEVAANIASLAGSIKEVPIRYRRRIGRPKLKRIHGFGILKDVLRLSWAYNPVFFIFAISSLILLPSLSVLTWVALELFFFGVKHYIWAIIGTIGTGIGVIALLLSIMALYIKRMEYRIMSKLKRLAKE